MVCWRSLWLVTGWLCASAVAAQSGGLEVVRGEGAEGCPDARALLLRVEQLRGRPDAGEVWRYRVSFARDERGFVATIGAGGDATRARVLRDRGASCVALERAAAVTLSLLLDSDARESAHPVRAPASAQLAPVARRVPAPQAIARAGGTAVAADEGERSEIGGQRSRMPLRLQLALGGGGLLGVLRPLAPAFGLELSLGAGRLRGGLGGVFAPEQSHALGPGRVHERLIAATARACFAPWLAAGLRLDACTGLYGGALHARADGYTRDEQASRSWLALPIGVALASSARPFGWELDLALLVPLRRDDFAVDALGVAYASPKVAGLLTVRGYAAWEW